MKIIIIAFLVSYAFCAAATVTLTPDSTGCKIDVTATTATAGDSLYYAIAECTTAPTGGATVTTLKTAGCSWWSVAAFSNATNIYVFKKAGTLATSEATTETDLGLDVAADSTVSGCTGTPTSGVGTLSCAGVITLTEGTSYYYYSNASGSTALGTNAFTSITNPCGASSDSAITTMTIAALASVF